MLCSGTTVGTRAAMLKYLEIMYAEMKVWISRHECHFSMNGDDQSIHNYLFYSGQLPFAEAIPNRHGGIVNTVGVEGSKVFKAHIARGMAQGLSRSQGEYRVGSSFMMLRWSSACSLTLESTCTNHNGIQSIDNSRPEVLSRIHSRCGWYSMDWFRL